MKIQTHGAKIKITDAIESYIGAKIGRLDKYLEDPENITANVLVRVKGKDQTVEVTIPVKKFILRAEDTDKDLYAAIDLVSEKLERQIRKNKTRMKKKIKPEFIDFNMDNIEKDEEEKGKSVKRKMIETKPMSEEEAILQMNLLGHSFFVFENMETGEINIIYKRNDEDYGLIETK